MNHQPIERQFIQEDGVLEVHSIFLTIQGEGPHTGDRAVFIRLAGCNLQCPGCDTDYTSKRDLMSPIQLLKAVHAKFKDRVLVVITGGEPFRQNIGPLCKILVQAGNLVQIESNGVREPDPLTIEMIKTGFVRLVVSPKTVRIHPTNEQLACALKYVIRADDVDEKDGLPTRALEHRAVPCVHRPGPNFQGLIYINPYDEKDDELNRRHLAAAVQSCIKHGYRLGLQMHKIINME